MHDLSVGGVVVHNQRIGVGEIHGFVVLGQVSAIADAHLDLKVELGAFAKLTGDLKLATHDFYKLA